MPNKIKVPPPTNYESFSPSELFRFFFQIGHWTEGSFSDDFQNYTRGTLISSVTINKWKNKDVIPTRYSGPLFKMIEALSEAEISRKWIAAFETVWGLHSAGKRTTKEDTLDTKFSDRLCAQHRKWIEQIYSQPQGTEKFSAADIFTPLQLYEKTKSTDKIFDLKDILSPHKETWTFISGGPGSGKSMSALHMAASLCEGDILPIYIRGKYLSDIDIDITNTNQLIVDSFSIKSFLKHFRASSFTTAYLILDGLDEIPLTSLTTPNRLIQILSDLKIEQAACDAHHKKLCIIAFGRETHINFAIEQISAHQARHLSLLSLDGSPRCKNPFKRQRKGLDLRSIWWERYLAATQKNTDPTLPDFLCLEYDDFSEFGSDPLLSFLICQTAFGQAANDEKLKMPHEIVNAFTYMSNRNEIYKSIIRHISLELNPHINSHKFLSALQYIALSIWQSANAQSVPINKIYNAFESLDLKSAFDALGFDSNTPTSAKIFITSFYYRLIPHEEQTENLRIEFTHETFSDYLISTLIFDKFTNLISAFETKKDTENALKSWALVSQSGVHTPELAGFCQKEAALRFENLSHLNWDIALNIVQEHNSHDYFDGSSLRALGQLQHSNSLLFFLWSCLNLERQKRNRTHFSLTDNAYNFSLNDLRKCQRPSSISHQTEALIENVQADPSFLSFSLSGLNISSANMCQLSFTQGHMEHVIYTHSSFAMTHWTDVKVSQAQFTQSTFQQSVFEHWRVLETEFENCFFQGARFQTVLFNATQMRDIYFSQCYFSEVEFMSPYFETVVFDRCIFSNVSFSKLKQKTALHGAIFRHCTFLDMDTALQDIPNENLSGTISHNVNGKAPRSPQSPKIETKFHKFI